MAIAGGGTRRKVAANFNQPTNKSVEIVCDGAGKVAGVSGGARGEVAADNNSNQPSDSSVEMVGKDVGEVAAVSGGGRREVAADNNSNQPSDRSVGRLGENVGRARGSNVCTFCLGVCCSLKSPP